MKIITTFINKYKDIAWMAICLILLVLLIAVQFKSCKYKKDLKSATQSSTKWENNYYGVILGFDTMRTKYGKYLVETRKMIVSQKELIRDLESKNLSFLKELSLKNRKITELLSFISTAQGNIKVDTIYKPIYISDTLLQEGDSIGFEFFDRYIKGECYIHSDWSASVNYNYTDTINVLIFTKKELVNPKKSWLGKFWQSTKLGFWLSKKKTTLLTDIWQQNNKSKIIPIIDYRVED